MGAVSRISTRCDDDIDSNRWLTTWAVNTNHTQPRRQYFFICTQTGQSARSHDVRLHRLYIHNEKRADAVMVTSFTAIRAIKTLLWRRLCIGVCIVCWLQRTLWRPQINRWLLCTAAAAVILSTQFITHLLLIIPVRSIVVSVNNVHAPPPPAPAHRTAVIRPSIAQTDLPRRFSAWQ